MNKQADKKPTSKKGQKAEAQATSDQQIGLQLRNLRKEAFGGRGSLAHSARVIGVSTALLSLIERGDHPLSKVRAENLAHFPEGYGISPSKFSQLTGITLVRSGEDQPVEPTHLPSLTPVHSLGERALGPDNIVGQEYVNPKFNVPQLTVVEAHDDSMAPRFRLGDWIYIDREDTALAEGRCYLARVGGIYIVRVLRRLADQFWLMPENPRYPSQLLDDTVQVVGRASYCRPTGYEV